MNHKPLVSVIVPSHNHSGYIVECIKSIFHQSYDHFELIVIDDGSTDDSLSILKELKINYDFKLVSKKNEGLSKTLNLALKKYVSGSNEPSENSILLISPDKFLFNLIFLKIWLFIQHSGNVILC